MINERVKELRKSLKLSGEKFGERLGLSKTAISLIERGKNGLTEPNLKSICREFNVNEEWLRTGSGNMFCETVDDYLNKFNLNDIELKIVKTYLSMDDDQRKTIMEYIKRFNSQ